MKHNQNLITFLMKERNIVIQFKNVIHILSFCMVNLLLCCGGHFSNITFIDAKTKYRSPYHFDVSQPYLQNHIRTSLERPQDVCQRRPQDVDTSLGIKYQIAWGRLRNVCRRRPQDVGGGRPMALQIGQYRDVFRTLHWDKEFDMFSRL